MAAERVQRGDQPGLQLTEPRQRASVSDSRYWAPSPGSSPGGAGPPRASGERAAAEAAAAAPPRLPRPRPRASRFLPPRSRPLVPAQVRIDLTLVCSDKFNNRRLFASWGQICDFQLPGEAQADFDALRQEHAWDLLAIGIDSPCVLGSLGCLSRRRPGGRLRLCAPLLRCAAECSAGSVPVGGLSFRGPWPFCSRRS